MLKYIYGFLMIALTAVSVEASIAPPNCVCEITAKVVALDEEPRLKMESQKEEMTQVAIELEIISVGQMVKPGLIPEMTCDQYKTGQIITLYRLKERDLAGSDNLFKLNAVLKGTIEVSGDERGSWFNFNSIEAIPDKTAPVAK